MRHPTVLMILCLASLHLTAVAAPEASRSTIVDVAVRHTGAGQVDRSYVDTHTHIREGDTLDRAAIARDVRSLLDTGRFSAVSADVEARENGVALTYVLTRKLALAKPVVFKGSDHLSKRKLRDLLGLEVGDRIDDQTLGVRSRAIRDAFVEDYYPDVEITWTIKASDREPGVATVTVDIDAGRKSKVKRVRFVGNEQIERAALRRAVGRPSVWSPLYLFRKRRYSGDELEAMRLAVREHYRQQGFLDVAVTYPTMTRDDEGRQVVVIRIDEGPTYEIAAVNVTGVERFPQAEVEALVQVKPGVVASSQLLSLSTQRISDYYGSRGYARVRVRQLLDTHPVDGTVDVTFDVTEGELIRVGNIRIRGNVRTRDKVIRRELLLYPGDVLNEVRARRSERRLMNLGYFAAVRRRESETAVPNREDVIFEVEEKRTGQFMVGAGFSSVDNIIGFVEISQGNFDIAGWPFIGGGQKLNLRAQFGSERRDYKLSFVEPWFLNRKLALGFDLYRTDLNYTDYDLKRTGGAVSLSKALPGANRITFRYSLDETVITDVADTNEYAYTDNLDEVYFFSREEDTLKSALKTTLTHDTRNNPFIPTRGFRTSLFADIAGGVFGFDTDVYNIGFRSAVYLPLWWGHVFSVKGRYETVEAYGDTKDIPISERLFAGGGRTIRGFDYRDVGPKVVPTDPDSPVNYRPVGGRSMAIANIEYTVPIVDGVRLAAFYDIGGVWRDSYDFDADTLASSGGIGLRLDMPGFPIRIDRAWAIEADDDLTDTDNWAIWIGYDY